MTIDVQFEESTTVFDCEFGEVYNVSDGGYERGYASGEEAGYQKGYDKGSADGYANGYITGEADGNHNGYTVGYIDGERDGKKAEYDRFWDNFQDYGKRTNYGTAFKYGFTSKNFKPKYDIAPRGDASSIFAYSFLQDEEKVDLTALLENAGVKLDTSNTTAFGYITQGTQKIKRIPVIDASKKLIKLDGLVRLGYGLEIIDGLILQADGSNTWHIAFDGANALREISKIEGVIGNAIALNPCPLNKETITRVINALSDTTSGKSCSFSKWRVNKEFETEEGKLDGTTTAEWLALVATKPNWTISLA